jgi:hypothetical protein
MRFTFVILLFLSLGADAQMIIKAHANYRPYAVAAANLLLDDYPNAAAAYSLRKLDKDYTGSAIRVRRSNDNTEQDIGFTSSGDLDTGALKTFVGAGNSGFVTTWYDQSTNARNATQSTAANQPRVVNAGTVERRNGDVAIFYDGSNDNLVSSYSFSSSISFFGVVNVTGTATSNRIGLYHNSSFAFGVQSSNAYGIQIMSQAAAVVTTSPSTVEYATQILSLTNNASYLIYGNWNGNNSVVKYRRNAVDATNSTQTGSNLRTGNTSLIYYTGYISEGILYGSDQTSNVSGIETNINSYYGIY